MRSFVVIAETGDADVASDVLWGLGVRAIEERPGGGAGAVELWTSVGEADDAIERAVAALRGRWAHRVVEVGPVDERAAQRWRDFVSPMWIADDLVVVPAWQTGPRAATVVRIEPGGAFGLGDHPTTLLSLQATARAIRDGVASVDDVIDVGCGTGVIAVVAAMLLGRPVRAIDIATAAVEATLDNAARNGVDALVDADTADLGSVAGDYDLVVANILAPVLVSLADDLRRVTRPGGRLVISGILADAHQHVLDALAPMRVVRTDVLDGWASVELEHR